MSQVQRTTTPHALPAVPPNPLRTLQESVGAVMTAINAPIDAINMGIASATNGIAKALPSFPAATIGMPVLAIPHAHLHPPSLIPPAPPVPLPVIGAIALGCCVSVLIGGLPAARVGDIGFSPTCGGIFPQFEIFTGSSKVFIGGMRAARTLDVTMHCWPPKEWLARGAVAALVKAAQKAMDVMGKAGNAVQVLGIAADAVDAAQADNAAVASAHALAAGMGAAQMAADLVAMAVGNLMGKDPCVGSPMGAITLGNPTVLIGGFPMPSGMQIAGRILAGARTHPKKRGESDGVGPCGCPKK